MSGSEAKSATVNFFTRFTSSEQFEKTFKEGMGLVEETANYLDGPGRQDARVLDRHGAIAYATESMRLTTRLMQLASWLLLQRAISAGELTFEDARKEKHRISLNDIGRGHDLTGSEQIPESLKELVERSLRLHQRILKLDAMLNVQSKMEEQPAATSPINAQLDRLASAYKVARG
jgi:regulator of CtrA degradation